MQAEDPAADADTEDVGRRVGLFVFMPFGVMALLVFALSLFEGGDKPWWPRAALLAVAALCYALHRACRRGSRPLLFLGGVVILAAGVGFLLWLSWIVTMTEKPWAHGNPFAGFAAASATILLGVAAIRRALRPRAVTRSDATGPRPTSPSRSVPLLGPSR